MLAIINGAPSSLHTAGPPAEGRTAFKYSDLVALLAELPGTGRTGPACTNDGNTAHERTDFRNEPPLVTQFFIANQNFRIGVWLMRLSRSAPFVRSIPTERS